MKNIYATLIYGEKHLGMLITLLQSLEKNIKEKSVQVFYQDVRENKIDWLKKTWPQVEYKKTSFLFTEDNIQRISSKTLIWEKISTENIGNNVCFLDSDTIVLKDVFHFFQEKKFDLLFTVKKGETPLNTGVMLSRLTPASLDFFKKWREETMKIVSEPKLLEEAKKIPYSGCDQMSFYKIINYQNNKKEYLLENGVVVIAENCAILNETESGPITPEKHIIHYKSGWQKILLEGTNFTKWRTKNNSWEMFIYYLKTSQEAVDLINKNIGEHLTLKKIGIKKPYYLTKNWQENKLLYPIYFFHKWLAEKTEYPKQFITSFKKEGFKKITKKITK